MATRIFLGLEALLWLPYGIYCFLVPGSLAQAAGVVATTATGSVELRAMYGGLQAALGALALAAALRPALAQTALRTLAVLAGGLASARLLGALFAGGFSPYTTMGLAFEIPTLVISVALLRQVPERTLA